MKKRIVFMLAILVVCIFSANLLALAEVSSPSTTELSKDIIARANKGDTTAIQLIDEYFLEVIDKANNGDAAAIEILQNLDCFNEELVNAKIPKNGLKLKPGETVKYYFDDGSAISFGDTSTDKKNKDGVNTTAVYYKDKSWWFGPCYASLRTYIDNTGGTRYIAHIADCWGDVSSVGCTMSEPNPKIITNDANPAVVSNSSVVTLPAGAGTKSVYVKYNVDTLGIMTLVQSIP